MAEFLSTFLTILLNALWFAIIGRALLSWFDPRYSNPVSRFLYEVTEPILAPIRRLMPGGMMIDFSPLVALLIISMLRGMVS